MKEEADNDPKKIDKNLSRTIHQVEEHFHIIITENYSYEKFESQIDYLQWLSRERKKHTK